MGLQFILALLSIGANYLEQLKSKAATETGQVIDLVDQATLAVLQENAKVKGLTIDWSDPAAVASFIATLPTFTPIADTTAAVTPTPPPAKK
jgi:threonine/homoserine/homoserine lactone efflux protein